MSNFSISHLGITAVQFNDLFLDNVDIGNIHALGRAAGQGNWDSVDMLLNIALKKDGAGALAENILCDLFSGAMPSNPFVGDGIRDASLELYRLASKSKNSAMNKILQPSKLLFMAGAAMTDKVEIKKISDVLTTACGSGVERGGDLWGRNRFVESYEIDNSLNHRVSSLNSSTLDSRMVSNPAGALVIKFSGDNYLKYALGEAKKRFDWLERRELFPVNTGDHWIFLGVERSPAGKVKAVVFNSMGDLSLEYRQQLKNALSEVVDQLDENVVFVGGTLQRNVPNGCGIFVIEVAKLIDENQDIDMSTLLNQFSDTFSAMSEQEQEQFNVQRRRQAFGHCIPAVSG